MTQYIRTLSQKIREGVKKTPISYGPVRKRGGVANLLAVTKIGFLKKKERKRCGIFCDIFARRVSVKRHFSWYFPLEPIFFFFHKKHTFYTICNFEYAYQEFFYFFLFKSPLKMVFALRAGEGGGDGSELIGFWRLPLVYSRQKTTSPLKYIV